MPLEVRLPTFSIIMPLYNHAAYVEQAVRSVLAQTFGDWELVVVNDGSTDGGDKIVRTLAQGEPRIRLYHQANAGCSAARNAAVAASTGRWLTYLDSDDAWTPNALADFTAYIAAHPAAQFIYGSRHRLNDDGTITELAPEYQDRPTAAADLFQRMYISHLCVCYRRELLERVGGYDRRLTNAEDYDLYLRMSKLVPLEPLGKVTGLRRRHAGCASIASGFTKRMEAEVLRRFIEMYGGKDLVPADVVQRRLGRLYYAAAKCYFKERRYRAALASAAMGHRYARTLKSTLVQIASIALFPFGRGEARRVPDLFAPQE